MITPYSHIPAGIEGQIDELSLAAWCTTDCNESFMLKVIDAVRDITLVDAGETEMIDKLLVARRDGAFSPDRLLF